MSIAAIVAAITAIFTAIPMIIKLFNVAPEAKREDIQSQVNDEEKAVSETGRPQ